MHETLTRQRDDLLRQLHRANARISCLETQERNAGTLAVAHLERALDAERNLARMQPMLRAVRAWYQSWIDHEAVPNDALPEEQALYRACEELFGEETGS